MNPGHLSRNNILKSKNQTFSTLVIMRVNKHRPPNWLYFIYLIPDGRSFVTSFVREVAESTFEEKFIADFE